MAQIVAFVGQKGGILKSTLSRLVAREAASAGWSVKIADLDTQQLTSTHWAARRLEAGLSPTFEVSPSGNAEQAIKQAAGIDLLIIDAPARASAGTLEIARRADLIVQPSSPSLDDLYPGVMLFHELAKNGISRSKLAFALVNCETDSEEREARSYIEQATYTCLAGSIPNRPTYRQAQNTGRVLSEVGPVSLRKRVRQVAEAVASRLENEGSEA